MSDMIKRNAIRCLRCGDVIESKSVHDWVACSCGACFVDGGHNYCRVGGNREDIEFLTLEALAVLEGETDDE